MGALVATYGRLVAMLRHGGCRHGAGETSVPEVCTARLDVLACEKKMALGRIEGHVLKGRGGC